MLYQLPLEKVEAEKNNPRSQDRVPLKVPSLWAQSLWYLGQMIEEGLIEWNEIDPRGMYEGG